MNWRGLLAFLVVTIITVVIVRAVKEVIRRRRLIEKYGEEDGVRVFDGDVWQGMTAGQVLDSRGRPADIDRLVRKSRTKETWKYGQTGKNRFSERIFVEDDEVVGWEDK